MACVLISWYAVWLQSVWEHPPPLPSPMAPCDRPPARVVIDSDNYIASTMRTSTGPSQSQQWSVDGHLINNSRPPVTWRRCQIPRAHIVCHSIFLSCFGGNVSLNLTPWRYIRPWQPQVPCWCTAYSLGAFTVCGLKALYVHLDSQLAPVCSPKRHP